MTPGTLALEELEPTSFLCELFDHKYGDKSVEVYAEEGKVKVSYQECKRCHYKQYFTSFNIAFEIIKEGI